MKVSKLAEELEEFLRRLIEHRQLWGDSLSQPIPDYPVRNRDELEEQSRWLSRKLGTLRPYIIRFQQNWIMNHPATGVRWDALDAAVGLSSVSQIKGPSLRTVEEAINQIIGRLEGMQQEDEIPEDPGQPIRPGIAVDYLISGYLQNLHPYISRGCSQLFLDGHYAQAVEEGAKAVFQYIREVTGLTTDGADLINVAFSTTNPILAFGDLTVESTRNEQVGFMEMLKGFAKGVRNPLAHSHGRQEEMQKSFEYLVVASLFCRRIDDARPTM
jgi:uncharacterized protein (TIGR02391 family)